MPSSTIGFASLRSRSWVSKRPAGYETVVAASLATAGLPVVVVNPAQVRAFANALGKRAKTDPIDAAVIAHFIEATKPKPSDLDGQIREAIKASPVWREKDELLESVPGVGPAISGRLLAGLPELGSLDRRQIAALAGLDGRAKASSRRTRRRA